MLCSLFALSLFYLAACERDQAEDQAPDAVRMLSTPAAEGSFAPNLAMGSGGEIVLSWLEPIEADGHALKYASWTGSGWGDVHIIAAGTDWFANWADFPSVVPVAGDLWGAHWLVRRGTGRYAYDIHAAISTDAGLSWSTPFVPHTDGTETEHGFVSMFPHESGIGMVWLDGRKFVNEVTDDVAASGMTLRSATFGADLKPSNEALVDELICDCCQTDVALTPKGPVAVYRDRTVMEIRDIYAARLVNGEWQSGQPVSNDGWEIPGCPVNGPVIQADGKRLAVAWFSAPDEKSKVQVAWSNDSGTSFGPAIEVSSDRPLGHVGSALLNNGDLVVSWQKRTGNGGAELNLRRVTPDGKAGSVRVLAEARDIFAMSVPQLVYSGEKLLLAWTSRDGETYSVRTAIVPASYLD